MICPICNTELKENEKRCSVCGYYLNENEENLHGKINGKICPVCNTIIRQEDSVCPLCGLFIKASPEIKNTSDGFDDRNLDYESSAKQEIIKQELTEQETIKTEAPIKKTKNIWIKIVTPFTIVLLLFIGTILFFIFQDEILGTGNDTSINSVIKQEQKKVVKEDTNTKENVESIIEKDIAPITEKAKEIVTENPNETIMTEGIKQINRDDYCGYWTIRNNSDRELIIKEFTDNTVVFSLCYYRLDSIQNVVALLENNIAYFSTGDDGALIEGNLIFGENSISVQITQTERMYMPVEIMNFEEHHEQPMQDLEHVIDETSSEVQYLIRATALPVNIYNGPGYEYNIVGEITDKKQYTIVEEVETNEGNETHIWGRLLSGVGWINVNDATAQNPGEEPEYILPNSSTVLLTFDDIKDLSGEQLCLARNEIYARHGRKFEDDEIRNYFESQQWYNGTIEADEFSEDMLSEIEKSNTKFILRYE